MKEASAPSSTRSTSAQLSADLYGLSVTDTIDETSTAADSPQPASAADPFQDVPILSTSDAELYLFDTDADVFVIQAKTVKVQMASNGPYDSQFTLHCGAPRRPSSVDHNPARIDPIHIDASRFRFEPTI